ncbi:hypothetical protein Tco_0130206, partial [Tanacetum coccineum]
QRCQDTILGGAKAQTMFEAASKQSNDLPLSRVNTLGSGEDSMKLKELMEHYTQLSELVSLKELRESKNRQREIDELKRIEREQKQTERNFNAAQLKLNAAMLKLMLLGLIYYWPY